MGLFLQKTNIIRDYLEDLVDGRAFWPADIWRQYAPSLGALRLDGGAGSSNDMQASLACLNHMVADALTLGPSCLTYLERLRQPDVFRFCAIPQVMAIATLAKVVNNPDVFTGVVKIRKGQALRLITSLCSSSGSKNCTQDQMMRPVYLTFLRHTREIMAAIPPHHKQAFELASAAAAQLEARCLARLPASLTALALSPMFSPAAVLTVLGATVYLARYLYGRSQSWSHGLGGVAYMPRLTDSWDVAALAALVACSAYLLAIAGVPVVMRLANVPVSNSPSSTPMGSPAATPKSSSADDMFDNEAPIKVRSASSGGRRGSTARVKAE